MINTILVEDDLYIQKHFVDRLAADGEFHLVGVFRDAILQSPLSHLISDATYPTEGMPHPRVYGTFPRLLQHFVREKGALTWEQAIHKVTGRPAQRLRLAGKGVLAAGMDADLCVFDPEALRETGTYQEPCRMAAGMDTVLAAGVQ